MGVYFLDRLGGNSGSLRTWLRIPGTCVLSNDEAGPLVLYPFLFPFFAGRTPYSIFLFSSPISAHALRNRFQPRFGPSLPFPLARIFTIFPIGRRHSDLAIPLGA